MKIQVAHSPDSDDAFMFYALEEKKIDTGGIEFQGVLSDIETLNNKALNQEYEVTAISFHNYPYVSKDYYLMSCGASIGYKYGPIVVAKSDMGLKGKRIGVPGAMTTAYLTLLLYEKDFNPVFMDFNEIISAVENSEVDAGLIIHEGQLTYENNNLIKIVDLGRWWYDETKLPMPLGCNVVKKELGRELASKITGLLKESILYSLSHRKEALEYSARFARGLAREKIDKFVGMYVNERTIEYGEDDIAAVKLLLDRGYEEGIIPIKTEIEMV
ncbi:MAG: ABC transporter substrate-binding protein [Candidatus Altiarchaeales archaeon IMC4]|nr:MAG: ABC transporter substrate-binding protein [Candidatus Altiarchaeales archaeon IMC4]